MGRNERALGEHAHRGPVTPLAHPRPGYPLSGCSPAEPDSVLPGVSRITRRVMVGKHHHWTPEPCLFLGCQRAIFQGCRICLSIPRSGVFRESEKREGWYGPGWRLVVAKWCSRPSRGAGSCPSGNSDLLPGMYRPVGDHRIGCIGDFTERCCHGPSKLKKALLAGAQA
jgi:hypothetical protein